MEYRLVRVDADDLAGVLTDGRVVIVVRDQEVPATVVGIDDDRPNAYLGEGVFDR